ncbi:NOD3 protein [Pelomyxa schiedti]|nr:NOD3 protein [Pelomyxa schiedti]
MGGQTSSSRILDLQEPCPPLARSVPQLQNKYAKIGKRDDVALADVCAELANQDCACRELTLELPIGDKGAASIATALESNKSLMSLSLQGVYIYDPDKKIGNEGATLIARALEANKYLVYLEITENKIGDEGAASIASALESNKSLVSLNLGDNRIGDKGATSIARALESNKSLVSLNLRRNKIGNEGAKSIARALESNKSLVSLDLSRLARKGNKIGPEGATSMARSLESNNSLVSLNLGGNKIGHEGATSIARALESNKSLGSLDIRENEIGDEGAVSIARALESNKSLVSLNIRENEIGDEGAVSIARALESNASLACLDIEQNKIGNEGAANIGRALESNKSLVFLHHRNNKIENERASDIVRALESNKSRDINSTLFLWFTWVIHPTLGASLIVFLENDSLAPFNNIFVGGTKCPHVQLNFELWLLSLELWFVPGLPETNLSETLFESPFEILDQENRRPRSHPNAMALASGKEYFENNFQSTLTKAALQSASVVMPQPLTKTRSTKEEIPQQGQPNSSTTTVSGPITAAPIALTSSLDTPPTPPALPLRPLSLAPKLDSDAVSATAATTRTLVVSPAATTPFQIQVANAEQTCFWLDSIGVDDDCLKIIRANKLRGRTLANYSVQQLCDLGLVTGDAEFIVEEVKLHLARYLQEQQPQQQQQPSTVISSPLEGGTATGASRQQQPPGVGAAPLFSAGMSYKCFAFVVGNESYGRRSLKNAINDAESIYEFLKTKCQFEVVCHKNIPNLEVFDVNLRKFKETLIKQKRAGNKVASIFYFAGHGRQVEGHNFLLMTDDETAFEETTYDLMEIKAPMLGSVIDGMKRYSDLTIGILDACRQSNDKTAFKTRGSDPTTELQLTKEDFRAGCILIYPTSPGRTTLDVCTLPNRQNHGFFTGCFLEVVENAQHGTPWNDLESAIIQMVQTESHDEQTPWATVPLYGEKVASVWYYKDIKLSTWQLTKCGRGSPARLLSHNGALREQFGREWVVGCSRWIGTTVTLPIVGGDAQAPLDAKSTVNFHVFMGLSATLGVVSCKCLGESQFPPRGGRMFGSVQGCVGDDRFVVGSFFGGSCIANSEGKVVASLEGEIECDRFGFWLRNKKWFVRAEPHSIVSRVIVWRVDNNGAPVSRGVRVKCTVPLSRECVRISPFDPCGDEIVFVGEQPGSGWGAEPVPTTISFVDLEKSIEAGVTVAVSKRSVYLPHSTPFDVIWASPSTILVLYRVTSGGRPMCAGFSVLNTVTGQVRSFSEEMYTSISTVWPSHITALRRRRDGWWDTSSVCEIYCASSDLSHPSFSYDVDRRGQPQGDRGEIYYSFLPAPTVSCREVSICDVITGRDLAVLTYNHLMS